MPYTSLLENKSSGMQKSCASMQKKWIYYIEERLHKRKSQAQRVLSVENGIPKLEVSITGTGIFTGNPELTETWTYWTIQRSDGTSYGEGQGEIMTKDGSEVAAAKGRGEGRMTDSGKMRYHDAVFFAMNSKSKLPSLNIYLE
jgi:hypothetical protein